MDQPGRRRWDIGDVLARTDLERLLDELAQPANHNTQGRRWHCPIPGHDDQHASVTMHTDHRGHERWRCWSGDHTHRGDAIDLVTATQAVTRAEAIEWLANRAGMTRDHPPPPVTRKQRPSAPSFVPLHPDVVQYAHACEHILWTSTGTPVRDWLHSRGFHDDLLRANHVGADPGRHLLPRRRGLPHGATIAATLPALNPDGDIQYLQARYLQPAGSAKYDNPAAALGSNPRLAWTRTTGAVAQPGLLLVCEGIPDALTAAAAGYTAVAILGSQAPDHRVAAQLARHAEHHNKQLVAVIDADPAGRSWGRHLTDLLDARGHQLTILEPPEGLDLNIWATRNPAWAGSELVARRISTLECSPCCMDGDTALA